MTKLMLGAAIGALTMASAHANEGFSANRLHIDALSGPAFDSNRLHIDALGLDPQRLHIDALGLGARRLHIDALGLSSRRLHIDALNTYQSKRLHIDALGSVDPNRLHIDALRLHIDALSGYDAIATGQADAFWGTFDPDRLHIDALDFDANRLHIDALRLHIDALNSFDPDRLHIDALRLHIDALAAFDPDRLHIDALRLHIDALQGFDPDRLHIDALRLHIDALAALDPSRLHIDALAAFDPDRLHIDALRLHIDALNAFDPERLHIDALRLHIDALASFDISRLHIDALRLHIDALRDELDALRLHIDALDLDALAGTLDPEAMAALRLHIDALGGLDELRLHIDALGQAAQAIGQAYDAYTGLLGDAEAAFGDLVNAKTGQSFDEGFLSDFLKKHGLEGDGFADFLDMSDNERTSFLIDLADQLNTFLGIDIPDHWMGTVNWTPLLSEIAGYGAGVTVGVVDQGFEGAGALSAAPEAYGPVHEGQTHGLEVSGVLAGALDGEGVMGVAPSADVVLSNPFGANAKAELEDVTASIAQVGAAGASIINLSLGEAGYTFSEGWVETFSDPDVVANTSDSLFIMASGNDGAVQENDVDFGQSGPIDRIVLVGALGLDGNIASFSNTPGEACFTVGDVCTPMKDRFLVAPGEAILVTTEDGGVTRTSGTSFAAPIVSGAAALLQSRWPWLSSKPQETAEILFRTATDLGEEGVDDVYGWGLLDIGASQRPINPADLQFLTPGGSANLLGSALTPRLQAQIDPSATVTVFETIGSTVRDFEVPLSSLGAGAFDPSVGIEQGVERYFGERLGTPVGATQSVAGLSFSSQQGFTDAAAKQSVHIGSAQSAWTLSLEAREPAHGLAVPQGGLTFETHGVLRSQENGVTFRFGQGDGALAFQSGSFAMTSDHDIDTGGVNPILGLASGGNYLHADLPVGERLTLSGGISRRTDADLVVNPFSGALTERIAGTEGYGASAASFGLTYGAADWARLTVNVTALRETQGFLGGQSLGALSFGDQVDSRALTVGSEHQFGNGVSFALSGTVGRSNSNANAGQGLLRVGQDGVTTTAYQAAVAKTGLFGKADQLRLTFAQPLTVENGRLEVQTFDVVDRATGQLGLVADAIALNGARRRHVAEMIYATPIFNGAGDISFFGQVDTAPLLTPNETAHTMGLRFTSRF